jgi:hypothetical protein
VVSTTTKEVFMNVMLLAKRNMDIGNHRTRVVCRLHALLAELAPGGMAKELYVSEADVFLAKLCPETPAQQMRFDLALELMSWAEPFETSPEYPMSVAAIIGPTP